MRLELSRSAQADLDEIRNFSVQQFGVERAIQYLDAIEQAFRRLLDHPLIGTQHAEVGESVLSFPVGSHRIFYDVMGDQVIVQRVLHKAMDVERWV